MRSGLVVVLTLTISAALALPAHAGGFGGRAPAGGFRQAGHFKPTGGFRQAGGFHAGGVKMNGWHGHQKNGHHAGHRPDPFRHPFRPHPFRPLGSTVSVFAPPVFYGSLYAAPTYADPPAVYAPPVEYAPSAYIASPPAAPPPPPTPSVIEYPQGRYELRGDGYWTPYTWEWVPNVPPPPPAPPPTALRPPPAPAAPPEPPSRRSLYRWTDDQGVVNFTDSIDSVPEAERAKAKRLTP